MRSVPVVSRPFELDRLAVVPRGLEQQKLKTDFETLSEHVEDRYRLIVGKSTKMQLAVAMATKAAASNATVLLLGESGTGKELFARFIHNHSERAGLSFIAINSVGLSKELLESELFGHEQGAFTGAHKLKKGKVELAHGGTIFFDEIGDISAELQAKLLRFLQEREFERVGGGGSISVDVRIIAATNRDLEAALKKGLFREDLYHRLNVIPLRLPPLRERKEDISFLAEYFLKKYSTEIGKTTMGIDRMALDRLLAYDWPGNVRELANTIERAVVLGSGATLDLAELPSGYSSESSLPRSENLSYRDGVNAARKDLVLKALGKTNGNRAAAARLLGLETKYFLRLIKSLQIE